MDKNETQENTKTTKLVGGMVYKRRSNLQYVIKYQVQGLLPKKPNKYKKYRALKRVELRIAIHKAKHNTTSFLL